MLLKFYGLGINDNYQAKVRITYNGNLICEKYTYNGNLYINLKPCRRYKIEATFMGNTIVRCIYIYDNDVIPFFFNHSYINNVERTITFTLKDLNYDLLIEKGVLILNGKAS